MAKSFQVTIGNVGRTIACARDETILHAAVLAGIDYPYACASGNCGTCLTQIDTGKVTMLPRGDASLSPAQVAAGVTLAEIHEKTEAPFSLAAHLKVAA